MNVTTLMPAVPPTPCELVERLDARHEELIQKLDELNTRIEAALADLARSREEHDVLPPLAA